MRSKIEANEYKDYIPGFIFISFCLIKRSAFSKQTVMETRIFRSMFMKTTRTS